MQILTEFTPEHVAYWEHLEPRPATFRAPAGVEDCGDAEVIITCSDISREEQVVRVAWKPDEIELAALAQGGTIWLSTWGTLLPHMLEIQAPEPASKLWKPAHARG